MLIPPGAAGNRVGAVLSFGHRQIKFNAVQLGQIPLIDAVLDSPQIGNAAIPLLISGPSGDFSINPLPIFEANSWMSS